MKKNKLPRHVLAAYYNDARLNIRDCLNDIRIKTGRKKFDNDDQNIQSLKQLALARANPEDQKYLIKQLRNRFRSLDPLTDSRQDWKDRDKNPLLVTPADYEQALIRMFTLIQELRNTTAHAIEKDLELEKSQHEKLFHDLRAIYSAALGTVKQRFQIDKETIDPLNLCDRNGKTKPPSTFNLALCSYWDNPKSRMQSENIYDFGHVLLCSLFLDKTQGAELVNYFWQAGCWPTVTPEQKKVVQELVGIYRVRPPLRRLHSDNHEEAVTLDAASHLSRCPRILFDALHRDDQNRFRISPMSESTDQSVEQGTFLSDRKRDRFVELLLHFFDFDTNGTTDSRLRFAVDLGQLYFNLRVKPGSEYTDGRPRVRRLSRKIIGYGRLTDFDNTIDPEKAVHKPEVWRQLEKNHSLSAMEADKALATVTDKIQYITPYIVPCYPHYHYADDRIGFRIDRNQDACCRADYPDLKVKIEDKPGPLNPVRAQEMEPEFWISSKQLVSLAFYIHLQKQYPEPYLHPAILLSRYKSGMKQLYKALAGQVPEFEGESFSDRRRQAAQSWLNEIFKVRDGMPFAVSLSDLPKIVTRYLVGHGEKPIAKKKIIARTETLIEETDRKLYQLNNMVTIIKKRGKKGFRPIKCGHIADFLTDDLLRFQPVDKEEKDGGKLNSQQYQILQASLAYYSIHLDEPPQIVDLLTDAGLLTGDFPHPFLNELGLQDNPGKYAGLLSFYNDYLRKRKIFLEKYKKYAEKQKDLEAPGWLRIRQRSTLTGWLTEQSYTDADGRLQLKPLPLPANLLYTPILHMVAESLQCTAEQLFDKGKQSFIRNGRQVTVRPSVSWLIQIYFREYKNDDIQEMYRYRRGHALFDTYLDTRNMSNKEKFDPKKNRHLSEEERIIALLEIREETKTKCVDSKFDSSKNKQNQRKTRTEKLCKFLKLYKHREKVIRHLSVEDSILYLYAENSLQTLQFSDPHNIETWKLKDITERVFSTPISFQYPVPETEKFLFHKEFKIKNLGEFRLQVRDRRLPGLLLYYPEDEKEIHIMEIRSELSSYRKIRVKAMEKVHKLETHIYSVYQDELDTLREQKHARDDEGKTGKKKKIVLSHRELLNIFRRGCLQAISTGSDISRYEPFFTEECVEKTIQMRNALAHNQYPPVIYFRSVAQQVQKDPIPTENPTLHRKVAVRLFDEINHIYDIWHKCLQSLQQEA